MVTVRETATRLLLSGPKKEVELLITQLEFRPPSYWRSPAYQLYKMTDGERGWSGFLCPIRVIGRSPDRQTLEAEALRGHFEDVANAAQVQNVELDTSGKLPRPFSGLVPDDLPNDLVQGGLELDEGQRECVTNWLKEAIGINHIAVNGGKTLTFAAAASFIKRSHPKARVLYMTQSERLVRQAFKEMKRFLPDWDVTQFGGGSRNNTGKDMVVATGAMLNKHFKALVKSGWFKTFMVALADESHHVSSPSFQKILKNTPAFFRLGASDTLAADDPVRQLAIRGLLGPVLDRQIFADELVAMGRSARPTIYIVDDRSWVGKYASLEHTAQEGTPAWCLLDEKWEKATYAGPTYELDPDSEDGLRYDKHGEPVIRPNFQRLILERTRQEVEVQSRWCLLNRLHDQGIVRFKERNKLIADWAAHFSQQGWPTLVVATRTLHVLILKSLIQDRVKPELVRVLYGEHNSVERDDTFEWLKSTPGSVLISPLIREGVSINEIKAGVIADHVVSWEVMEQLIGRFVRKKLEGPNEASLVMFIDRQHPVYRKASISLLKRLESNRAYSFCYPVIGPDTMGNARKFQAGE